MGRGAGRSGVMRGVVCAALTMLSLAWPASARDAAIAVPSGEEIHWIETLHDTQGPEGLTLRFRFLAPAIGGANPVSAEVAQQDMAALCNDFALPRVPSPGPKPAQIIISLSERSVPFGEADEGVVQYFEAYSIADGSCVWELF